MGLQGDCCLGLGLGLDQIDRRVGLMVAVDFAFDALSLASIYFLATIGLAITFGVMRVINKAHGEIITMGFIRIAIFVLHSCSSVPASPGSRGVTSGAIPASCRSVTWGSSRLAAT